jgi:hypothetical protein
MGIQSFKGRGLDTSIKDDHKQSAISSCAVVSCGRNPWRRGNEITTSIVTAPIAPMEPKSPARTAIASMICQIWYLSVARRIPDHRG